MCGAAVSGTLAICVSLSTQILINEVHYDPDGPDTGLEFVELINAGREPVPLSGYELESGNGASPDEWKTEWSGDMVTALDPDSLYVIGESDVVPEPDEITSLDLQNGPDAVRLLYFGEVVDVLGWGDHSFAEYCEGNPAEDVSSGFSLSRRPDGYDTDNNLTDFDSAVPSPRSFISHATDLRIELDTVGFTGNVPAGESSLVPFVITNSGRRHFTGQTGIELTQSGRTLASSSLEVSLSPRESVLSGFAWVSPHDEYIILSLRMAPGADEDTTNNITRFVVRVGDPNPAIVINEIMANPSEGSEWVEITSLFEETIETGGWNLGDGTEQYELVSPLSIAPGEFTIICQDTSEFMMSGCRQSETMKWETLSRDDTIVLRTGLGVRLDSVSYVSAWGIETGKSLERIRPDLPTNRDNWGTCQDESGQTPCRRNSIYLEEKPVSGRISAAPNPFPADGTSGMILSYEFPFLKAYSRVRVFDRTGVVVRTLADGKWLHGRSSELWDGTDDSGELVPTGIYIALVEATSEEGKTASAKLAIAVVRADN